MCSPALHLRQTVLPVSVVVESSAHFSQLVTRPSSALKESMAQALQSEPNVAPTVSDHLPGAHLIQSSDLVTLLAEEYVPTGHFVQTETDVAPSALEYNPTSHETHDDWSASVNVPAKH